ncbi:acetylornithine transaminase [Bacillus massilinigeriensis]|uniref:acetylornithine transaminase n=1 Tax=Bacillus massilionigeriensis TaxID=1805475 RepID=UPI00096B3494|nr:acetylornithine transaminase [Bacillus massilionigeriensis]
MSYLFPTYAKWEVAPNSAKGTYLIDETGKQYLDFTSGIGVCNLGHQPQEVKDEVLKQLDKFWHVSNLFQINQQETAAKILATAANLDAVFFANSGAEANEAAIKLARKATGKSKIITFEKSFHGRTFATMAATGQDKIKQGFGTMLETFVYVPYNDITSLEQAMDENVAAVMLEVIQGEGGINVGNEEFLHEVEKLCKKFQALLIIDEIQTGVGRTGKPFAFQHFGLDPDIITVAKGLGSGFPIGAMVGKAYLKEFFGPGSHGSTFGGNPVAIAAAIATMNKIFDKEFLEEINQKSQAFTEELENSLQQLPIVKEIKGLGFMIGIDIQGDIPTLLAELREEGLLVLSAGESVIRLLPPLTASIEELKEGINLIAKVLQKHSLTAI